jgi:hypothetical protein
MKRLLGIGALLLLGPAVAGAVTVDFEDLGVPAGGQIFDLASYASRGFVFTSGPDAFQVPGFPDHLHIGSRVSWGYNGTTILLPHGHVLMTVAGGGLFSLQSVHLTGFQTDLEDPIHVIGVYSDDSTVTSILTLDGHADGPGGDVDFQAFVLPASFADLKRVEFKLNGTGVGNAEGLMGIDNIDATPVPEPSTLGLLAMAIPGLLRCRHRRSPLRE